jgi:hypothetical protein
MHLHQTKSSSKVDFWQLIKVENILPRLSIVQIEIISKEVRRTDFLRGSFFEKRGRILARILPQGSLLGTE